MSNLVVVASVCACKHNVNHFSPIMVESWPWHPIANLRSWPQATTKTPSVFQISWRTKVYTTKQVIWTLCVPDISPKSRVGWDKFIKTNLTGADERLCVRSVRAALQWLLFLLAALVVFLLSAFFFLCVTSGWRGHRFLWWNAVSLLMWAVSLKAAVSWKVWKGKKTIKQSLAEAVCWHNVFPVTRLC